MTPGHFWVTTVIKLPRIYISNTFFDGIKSFISHGFSEKKALNIWTISEETASMTVTTGNLGWFFW